jgi:hypothetical protein
VGLAQEPDQVLAQITAWDPVIARRIVSWLTPGKAGSVAPASLSTPFAARQFIAFSLPEICGGDHAGHPCFSTHWRGIVLSRSLTSPRLCLARQDEAAAKA